MTPTHLLPAWQLRAGDVLTEGDISLTVAGVQVLGPLVIIDFTDGTSTAPIRAATGCPVAHRAVAA